MLVDFTYIDFQTLGLSTFGSVLICLPIQAKTKASLANDIDVALITANNLFADCIKKLTLSNMGTIYKSSL